MSANCISLEMVFSCIENNNLIVVLTGGIDETGRVPENCIFVQVQKPVNREASGNREEEGYTVITGDVMVTKHPVMHPGKFDHLFPTY